MVPRTVLGLYRINGCTDIGRLIGRYIGLYRDSWYRMSDINYRPPLLREPGTHCLPGRYRPKGNNTQPNLPAVVSAVTIQPAGTAVFQLLATDPLQRLLGFSSSLIVVARLVKPTMVLLTTAEGQR